MEVNALNKLEFLPGNSEAAQTIRSMNWHATIVGSPETWPQSLLTTLNIVLPSHIPMFIVWGTGGTLFYNDACQPLTGKLPVQAMGKPAQEVFAGKWDAMAATFAQVMQGAAVTLPEVTMPV